MNNLSSAKIEALLDEQRRDYPRANSETIWMKTLERLTQLDDIKHFIEYGFNPELPSSSQLINQDNQTKFGSNLYTLFVEKGRNPHTLRDSQTLLFSLRDVLKRDHGLAYFSLSDVGMGIYTNMPVSWSKLRAQHLLDWNQPCAEHDGLYVYPAELALLTGNVALAHRILEDGGMLQSPSLLPTMVVKFLNDTTVNPIVSYRVWNHLQKFNAQMCNEVFEQIATEKNWSLEQREEIKKSLQHQPVMVKQHKSKKAPVETVPPNLYAQKHREALVHNLLNGDVWTTFKDIVLSHDTNNYDIVHCIYEKENCSLECLDDQNPLTPIVQDICSRQNVPGARFFLSKGLKGDQVLNPITGNTVLHTWMSGRMYPSMIKEYVNAAKSILKATSNCSVVNSKGETALFNLLENNSDFDLIAPIIEVMVQRGLDVRVRNHNNCTAADVAMGRRGLGTSEALLKNLAILQDKSALLRAVEDLPIVATKRRM